MKAYTDITQSKRLAEILPLESADMEYLTIKETGSFIGTVPFVKDDSEVEDSAYSHTYNRIACWSLSALLDLMPKIHGERPRLDTGRIQTEKYYVEYPYHESTKNDWYSTKLCDSAIDACYEMILKLNELNLL